MEVTPKDYQKRFLYSQARHPALVASWSTGKTMFAIFRSRIYSKGIPENLGVIFRKTERSLFDSTLKDFERYTKLKVDSHRNLTDPNGSITMFRHIDEIDDINKQNINLGWFYIEQGDELESDREFFMLFGRLRRQGTPTPEFLSLGLPLRSGWVIGNAGDHWMKRLWKEHRLEDAAKDVPEFQGLFTELIEATYLDNLDNIPPDTVGSWKILEKTSPLIYKQYVLNDWSISSSQFIVIPSDIIEALRGINIRLFSTKRIIACDPATGGDECVIYFIENGKIKDEKIIFENDSMKIAGIMKIMGQERKTNEYAVDSIGVGKGVGDRLREMGGYVREINSADKSSNDAQFYNLRTEMWWHVRQLVMNKELPYPEDPELRRQLSSVRYKVINSNGRIQLEPKEKTKERLGCSPDRADAYVYGIHGLQFVRPTQRDSDYEDTHTEVGIAVTNALTA